MLIAASKENLKLVMDYCKQLPGIYRVHFETVDPYWTTADPADFLKYVRQSWETMRSREMATEVMH